jgi:hypothetical protein
MARTSHTARKTTGGKAPQKAAAPATDVMMTVIPEPKQRHKPK